MAVQHVVRQGEHLTRIARDYGFADYRTLWDHPENAGLRQARKNPNVLFPGDRIYIPDRQLNEVACPTGQRHRFLARGRELVLRVMLKQLDGTPVPGTACLLSVEGPGDPLDSDGDGKVEAPIPATAEEGTLQVNDWNIAFKIGHLDPVEEQSGWQARLNNLGYRAGEIGGASPEQLRSAVEEFQCDYGLQVDGICGAQTQAKLKQVYGC